MDKILTVVVPTYNMEKYLRKCLDSLIIEDKELFNTLEVLVVNDGSRDSSSAIAHEYQDNYPDVFRVIDKENGNYGSCVNRGLKEALGKYIKILDADDFFENWNFNLFLKGIRGLDVDLVLNDCVLVNSEHKKIKQWSFKLSPLEKQDFNYEIYPQMHCVTYKAEILRNMNYLQTEGISYTDQEWVFYPITKVKSMYYMPIYLYCYLYGREGQTMDRNVHIQRLNHEFQISRKMIEFVDRRKDLQDGIKEYLSYKIISKLCYIYKKVIIECRESRNQELIDFDDYLNKTYPSVYLLTNSCAINKYIPFRFIRYWRNNNYRVCKLLPAVIIDRAILKAIKFKDIINSRIL